MTTTDPTPTPLTDPRVCWTETTRRAIVHQRGPYDPPDLDGVAPGRWNGHTAVADDAPEGYSWIPVQSTDLSRWSDEEAAEAYAAHVGSPLPPQWGEPLDPDDEDGTPHDREGDDPDVFVCVPDPVMPDGYDVPRWVIQTMLPGFWQTYRRLPARPRRT